MTYLENIRVVNFKRFVDNTFYFDKKMNIVIGKNDSGKSTLLQAIDICLNQRGNGDRKNRNEYGTLLNIESKEKFLNTNRLYSDLPSIRIEIELKDLNGNINSSIFNGNNNLENENKDGILFEYSFDEQYKLEYEQLIKDSNNDTDFIPFEFYSARWQTFSGEMYSFRRNPLKSILIDTDKSTGDSYKAFTRQVFSALKKSDQNAMSINLKKKIDSFNKEVQEKFVFKNNLEIDPNRFVIEDNLDVVSSKRNILLRDMGSGTENIIKTRLAMNVESKLILLEEPESHLSFDLARQQIRQIQLANNNDDRQLIITTHSPLLASKLSINNLKWLNKEGEFVSFKDISEETSEFFQRADNIDILQVILSKRVILVEGATEYMIMVDMIKQVTGKSADEQRIHIVSMGGNYYKRFKEVVNKTKNKVLIITDNDESDKRIKEAQSSDNDYLRIAMPDDKRKFTFEVALYEENKEYFQNNWEKSDSKTSWKNYTDLDGKLVYLLKNKTKSAFEYNKSISDGSLRVPQYIKDGIEWLTK